MKKITTRSGSKKNLRPAGVLTAKKAHEAKSAQSIFDAAATHLATQGRMSMKTPSQCLYRGPGGLKCAVGCLITDAEYDPAMDEYGGDTPPTSVTGLAKRGLLPKRLQKHMKLLERLQMAHDLSDTGSHVRAQLRDAAVEHHLSFAILDTLKFPKEWR